MRGSPRTTTAMYPAVHASCATRCGTGQNKDCPRGIKQEGLSESDSESPSRFSQARTPAAARLRPLTQRSILMIVLLVLGAGLRVPVLLVVLLLVCGGRSRVFVLLAHNESPLLLKFSMLVCTPAAKNIRTGLAKMQKI